MHIYNTSWHDKNKSTWSPQIKNKKNICLCKFTHHVSSFIERRYRLIAICSSTHIEVLFSVRVEDHLIFHFTAPVPASAADFTRNVWITSHCHTKRSPETATSKTLLSPAKILDKKNYKCWNLQCELHFLLWFSTFVIFCTVGYLTDYFVGYNNYIHAIKIIVLLDKCQEVKYVKVSWFRKFYHQYNKQCGKWVLQPLSKIDNYAFHSAATWTSAWWPVKVSTQFCGALSSLFDSLSKK